MQLRYPAALHDECGSMKTQGTYPSGYPQGAIVHFTAGGPDGLNTVKGGIRNGFCFFVIAPDGNVLQNFELNRWGYHAGKSSHQKLGNSVSRFLVGIEVCNAGKLRQVDAGTFRPWFNDPDHYRRNNEPIPPGVPNPARDFRADAVRFVERRHNREAGWYHKYTPEQEQALTTLILWLKQNAPGIFQLEFVLGHDEVSPGRKNDPGGALSMTMPEYRAHLAALLSAGPGEVPLPDTSHTEVTGPALRAADPRLVYAPDAFRPEALSFQKAANRYPGIRLVEDGYAGEKTSEAFHLLTAYYLKGDPRATDKPSPPPAQEEVKKPRSAGASAAGTAARRTKIAAQIVTWEARRDNKGRIAIYKLPGNDGGGSYEVAGINEKYHPDTARQLASLVNAGKHAHAEKLAAEHIAQFTESIAAITRNAGTEAFLRDTAFNRGPTGAVKVVQVAMNVSVTGRLGDETKTAFERLEKDTPVELLQRLRNAREEYERKYIGFRANFWPGLTNRWNKAHLFALELLRSEAATTAAAEVRLSTTEEAALINDEGQSKPVSEPQEALWPPLGYGPDRYNVVAERFQEYANAAARTDLEEDGMAGQKTSDAFHLFTGYLLAGDPRLE
jgi:hypothetical protein